MRTTPAASVGWVGLALMGLAVAAVEPRSRAEAGPPIFYVGIIISGGNQGLQLFGPKPTTGTTLRVKANVNGDTGATGTISRSPGDAQSAFFRGRFGRRKLRPQPTLFMHEQPREFGTLSSGIARVHGALAAMNSHHRTPRQALTEGLAELRSARTQVLSSDRPQELKDRVVRQIDTAIQRAQKAQNAAGGRPNPNTLRTLITAAVKSAQIPFASLAAGGLNRGFDVLLQDDGNRSEKLQFNTGSGAYRLLCGGDHRGVGTITRTARSFSLSHATPEQRVQGIINTQARTGTASLQLPIGTTVCTINDTDTTNNSPP